MPDTPDILPALPDLTARRVPAPVVAAVVVLTLRSLQDLLYAQGVIQRASGLVDGVVLVLACDPLAVMNDPLLRASPPRARLPRPCSQPLLPPRRPLRAGLAAVGGAQSLGHAPICGAEGAILRASYAKRFQAAYHGQVERTEQQERTGVSERAAQELLAELGRRSGRERLGDGR